MNSTTYIKTGQVKSKRKDIDRGVFRDMPTKHMLSGVCGEIWARFSTEILAVLLFGSWALWIWQRLGV